MNGANIDALFINTLIIIVKGCHDFLWYRHPKLVSKRGMSQGKLVLICVLFTI